MMRTWRAAESILAFVLLTAVFSSAPLFAQIATGGVTGTVTDPTGAVVPGAIVALTNTGTHVTQTTNSTSTGTYSFMGVQPGTYNLRAEAAGFKAFVDKGLLIHVQQTATVNVDFVVGAVTQNVTVTAAPPLLQSESGAIGQTIGTQAVNDLPLQTRDWASLAQLSAGVATAPVGQPSSDSGSSTSAFFSVNGVNLWQNDFRLNGINDNIEVYGGSSVGSNAAITPPPDAIEEFRLQTGDMNAQFGHSTGAVVNAVVKSGTNRFHGDVWEYFRNDALNANLWFNNRNHLPKPEYRQNLFGGTLGGPIVKNKTFFFVDYQGGRYITPSPTTATVPTEAMINSGFTNLQDLITGNSGTGKDALGRVFPHGVIFDPATTRAVAPGATDSITGLMNTSSSTVYVRDPFYEGSLVGKTNFVGDTALLNLIPAARLDPNAVKLLGVYPAPNASGLQNNFSWTPREPETTDSYDIKIDQHFNEKNTLFGVFDRSQISQVVPSALPGIAVGEGGGRHDSFPAYAWAAGYTHVFSPTVVDDMHVGMVHSDKLQRSDFGNTFGIPAQFGIQGIPQVANNGGIPPISINGFTHIGVGNYTPTLQHVYSIEGSDNITKVFRNHAFTAGVQVDDIEGDISQPPQGRGDINYNGQYTDIPNENSSLTGIGDLLLTPIASTVGGPNFVGGLTSFSGSNIAFTDDHRWYAGVYAQDDWKVTPSLTFNLGVRWDYFTPYAEIHGRQANFIAAGGNDTPGAYYISNLGCKVPRSPSFDALLASSSIKLNCISSLALGTAQKTNFAPRIGFAYLIRPTVVIRGGYGIAYGALGNLGYGGTLGTNYPFVYTSSFPSPNSIFPLVLNNGQTATMENAFTTINLEDPTINTGQGLNLFGRQFNYQTPYVQTVNFTVQDQFTLHDSVQIGYVGTMGRHLDNLGYNNSPSEIIPPGVNPQLYVPFPSFARNATYESTNATSSYNSMQATYEHQFSSGLSVLANYTYSKCMSDQHTQASQNQQYRAQWLPGFGIQGDYGLCDTDATNIIHFSGSYQLPVGHGQRFMNSASRATNALLGGWAVNFIYTYQGGQPFTVGCPVATSAFGCFADLVPGQGLYAGPHNQTQWLNPNAFSQPPIASQIGETSYAVLGGGPQQARGPNFIDLDFSVFKNFNVTEDIRGQFRAEAFNLTNTPQFAQPGSLNFTTSDFSEITNMRNGSESSRRIQLALKFLF
ncbi:MAG: TonB-dependent receptor domain-containing protein [Terriglobia bacterium]